MPRSAKSAVTFLMMMLLVAAATCCSAQPPESAATTKPDTITIIGIVKPAPAGAEESATVAFNKISYHITSDAKGKIVARQAANQKAEIRGTLSDRAGNKWITVTWCALVE